MSLGRRLLVTPVTIAGLEIPNRMWVAPMCQYMAQDGVPNDWHHVHLAAFANGGFGLILTESTAVAPEGRITPGDTGLWNSEQQYAWSTVVASVHARGSRIGVQLGHAGRKGSTLSPFHGTGSVPAAGGGWQTTAPSATPFGDYAEPASLSAPEIDEIATRFAEAAERAVAAGFDVIEIHAAHGYLLHQFLSPLSNTRTDEYGGSLENRARFLIDVCRRVRRSAPDTPLFVRVSATDWEVGGVTVDDTTRVCVWLRGAGADFIDVSTGGNTPHPDIPTAPGYQVDIAREVRRACGLPVSAVGLITEPEQAEKIVAHGDIDAVMIGRAALRDPHWAVHAAKALGDARLLPQAPHRERHSAPTT